VAALVVRNALVSTEGAATEGRPYKVGTARVQFQKPRHAGPTL